MNKMKNGGTKPCPPTLCPDGNGSCVNCSSVKKAGMVITGIVSGMANAIGNKKRKENEEVKGIVKGLVKDSKKTKVMKKGGLVKKQMGGYAKPQMGGDNTKMGIYGVPNAGRTDALGFKKGGSVKKAKLAAMAPPKGKITRADIITAAKRNARKKK